MTSSSTPLLDHIAAASDDDETKLRTAHAALFHNARLHDEVALVLGDKGQTEAACRLAEEALLILARPKDSVRLQWELCRKVKTANRDESV